MEIFLAIILAAAFLFGMASILVSLNDEKDARFGRWAGFVIACIALVLAYFLLG